MGEVRLGEQVHNFSKIQGFSLILRSGTQLEFGFTDPIERMSRLQQMVDRGLSLDTPQQVDLNSDLVAIATPLPPISPRTRGSTHLPTVPLRKLSSSFPSLLDDCVY